MGQPGSPHLLGREFHHSWDSSLGQCTAAFRAGFRAPLLTRQGSHCLGTRGAASQSPRTALPGYSPRSPARRLEWRAAALGGAAAAASTLLAASLLARHHRRGGDSTAARSSCKLVSAGAGERDARSAFWKGGRRRKRGATWSEGAGRVGRAGRQAGASLAPSFAPRMLWRGWAAPAGAPAELGRSRLGQPGLGAGRGGWGCGGGEAGPALRPQAMP